MQPGTQLAHYESLSLAREGPYGTGTRSFSSSNQFRTTLIYGDRKFVDSTLSTIANRFPSGLNEALDHVAVLVDRTPEMLALAVDRDEDLVKEPRISRSTLFPFQFQCSSVLPTEVHAPAADRLVGHHDASFGPEIPDISKTDAESIVAPDGVAYDFNREAVTMTGRSTACHGLRLPVVGQRPNTATTASHWSIDTGPSIRIHR